MKKTIIGGILTLVIGGTAYTISQEDVIKNFSAETGMSSEQAEEYISGIEEEDLVSWNELGNDYINNGQEVLKQKSSIDCVNYEYEWQSSSLSCQAGKNQIEQLGELEIVLGNSYKVLGSDSAGKSDISKTITLLDQLNVKYQSEIVNWMFDAETIKEMKNTNSYNKSLLKAALESN